MKVFCFITLLVSCVLVFGHPHRGDSFSKCRSLYGLIPVRRLNVPDLGSSENELPVIAIEDARQIENLSFTLDKDELSGLFVLTNGVVEGESTYGVDFNYDPSNKRIDIYATLNRIRLTGLYEIIDGQGYIPTLGQHVFSGKGRLDASASGVVANFSITLGMDVQTEFLSLANLNFGFNFGSASIVAENLVVDGVPVEWETVNQINGSVREKFLEALDPYIHYIVEARIKQLIQGCTLEDLTEVVTFRNQANTQNFPQQH